MTGKMKCGTIGDRSSTRAQRNAEAKGLLERWPLSSGRITACRCTSAPVRGTGSTNH